MSELLYFALQYAAMGFEVFPIIRGTKTEYFHYPEFKNPETGSEFSWQYQASKDPERIKRFWTEHPNANIGIATGQRSGGLFVIDLDQKDNRKGIENFRKWIDDNSLWLPGTVKVRSPSGGEHLYFINAEKDTVPKREFWLPGVDIRGEDSYIVAPPSYIDKKHSHEGREGSYEFIVGITEIETIPSCDDDADILSITYEIRNNPKQYTITRELHDSEGIPYYEEVPFVPVEGTNTKNWMPEKTEGGSLKTSFSRTASGKIPKGERHTYLASKIGGLVNKLGSDFSAESILEMVIQDYYENCEDPDSRGENDAAFRRKYLGTIKRFQKRKEAEEKDPDFYKYAMAAWKAENPGQDFDSSGASWDDVRDAGNRAKEAGKTFEKRTNGNKNSRLTETAKSGQDDDQKSKPSSVGTDPDGASPEASAGEDEDPEELDLEQFHLHDAKGRVTGVYDYEIHHFLKEHYPMFIMGKIPYIYQEGVYQADLSGSILKTMIRKLMYKRFVKSTTERRIYDLFIYDADLQRNYEDLNRYPKQWICFHNAFYDPIGKQLIPHDPKYLCINQLPHDFDPEAIPEGDLVKDWLNFITPDPDDREMLLQYAGYCLTRDTRQQKFLILQGEGGTGKSGVLSMIEKMVGPKNVSNISLVDLNKRFYSFALLSKLVNSCADLEIDALSDVNILKQALGEDTLKGEAKGKDVFSFKSYAKLIFSTNELPIVRAERTKGFYRRLLILKMDRTPRTTDPDFYGKLSQEIDAFIHLAVDAVSRMYENGIITESKTSKEEVKRLRNDSDSVEAFIDSQLIRDPSGRIKKADLFREYEDFCQDMGRQPYGKQGFYRTMKTKAFSEVRANGVDFFKGIILRKNAPILMLEEDENSPGDGFQSLANDPEILDLFVISPTEGN